jgi:heavy metal sensor kinase
MFLKLRPKHTKSISFKLSILYSGLFIFSSLILFAITYSYVASTLKKHDRDMMLTELKEMAAAYTGNGLSTINELLEVKRKYHKQHPFFVRIADAQNRTKRMFLPAPWTEFNIKALEKSSPKAQPEWIRLSSIGGGSYLEVTSMRLTNGAWLQLGMSSTERDRILSRLRSTFWVVLGPMVLLSFICGWLLAFYVLRPVRNLLAAIKTVQAGRMEAHVPVSGAGDELDELAVHFNKMLNKIAAVLQAMKDCVDNVAHDLRTPVTRLRNLAENALQNPGNPSNHRSALNSCVEEAERITTMLNTLLDISEAESGVMRLDRRKIEIHDLVDNIVDAYSVIADEKQIQIRVDGDHTLTGRVDPNRMSQVLANLLDNATKYTPAGGRVDLTYFREKDWTVIQVRDNGSGIAPEELPRIWERLYRGRQSRSHKGLGLGLSQVKAIIEAHNGRVEAASEPGKGSILAIYIPVEN